MSPTYILETSRGARAVSFDSLDRARAAKAEMERRVGVPLRIIERTIQERIVQ